LFAIAAHHLLRAARSADVFPACGGLTSETSRAALVWASTRLSVGTRLPVTSMVLALRTMTLLKKFSLDEKSASNTC